MDVLIRFGFSIEDIKNMMDTNQEFDDIDDNNIYKIIKILNDVGCDSDMIKNIFITNPFVLNNDLNKMNKLIDRLYKYGINDLEILFDSNPYILNLDYKDIDKIYKKLVKINMSNDEIVDYFYYEVDKIM